MQESIILPLTKSPHQSGRMGPVEVQDWYRGLVRAKELLHELKPAKILVLANVHITGEKGETDLYLDALHTLCVPDEDILVVREGQETIEQIEIALALAKREGARLLIISTFLHYLRVRWLCRGEPVEHYIAWGMPRPREILTDTLLTALFPLIDIMGGREWFLEKVKARRLSGRF